MKTLLTCVFAASASICVAQNPATAPTTTLTPAASDVAPNSLPAGSKVFIEPMDGFETYLSAAFMNKKVPLLVVDGKDKADFILTGGSKVESAGWAKTLFISPLPHATASIAIKNAKTGIMIYAYNVDKANARKADQSTAEACAKHVKEFIEKSEKKK